MKMCDSNQQHHTIVSIAIQCICIYICLYVCIYVHTHTHICLCMKMCDSNQQHHTTVSIAIQQPLHLGHE